MRKRKIIAVLAAAVVLAVLLGCAVFSSDWFQRHYGYYGSHIQIYAYEDGRLLDPDAYQIRLIEDWYWDLQISKDKTGYSLPGDYGTFWFTLDWQGKHTEFFLENVNDWWRTNISLHFDTKTNTVRQTNIVWNNQPAFADEYLLEWQ